MFEDTIMVIRSHESKDIKSSKMFFKNFLVHLNHFIRKTGLNIPLDGPQKNVSIEIPRLLNTNLNMNNQVSL
jgi:hypothetical protein